MFSNLLYSMQFAILKFRQDLDFGMWPQDQAYNCNVPPTPPEIRRIPFFDIKADILQKQQFHFLWVIIFKK